MEEKLENKRHEDDNVIPYSNGKYAVALIAGIIVVIVVLIICMVNLYSVSTEYTTYDVIRSVTREDTKGAKYISYADGYIRYSNDGIAYFDKNGTSIWNQTYEISNAEVKICGDYVAAGDISGNDIYIFNSSGLRGKIDTALPITEIDVASQGVVAVALEDGNTNYINIYDVLGSKLLEIKTILQSDGYPLDMAISDDGTKLVVSYVSVSGEALQTNLTFYNFSEVGQNFTERVVGGFNHYGDSLVGRIDFVDNDTVLAIGENIISVYSIKQYPSIKAEMPVEQEIRKVFFSDGYVGIIFNNTEGNDKYLMHIYEISGKKILETTFSEEYHKFLFNDKQIIMYDEKRFTLMNIKGKIRYDGTFDMSVDSIMPSSNASRFMIVNAKYIQEIRLR